MTDDLYERYKESLRVGHVAVLRGSLNAAVDAYRSAAEIAPSRALPHTSLGGVMLRLGRLDEALVEYAAAVARAPYDEGALLGQAEALGAAGKRAEAAAALDEVAEIQAESGRLPEAADTLRRAMELASLPRRAARQQELMTQIRRSAGDHAAEQLLARALRLRDETILPAPVSSGPMAMAVAAPAEPQTPEVEVELPGPVELAGAIDARAVEAVEPAAPSVLEGETSAGAEPALEPARGEAGEEPLEEVATPVAEDEAEAAPVEPTTEAVEAGAEAPVAEAAESGAEPSTSETWDTWWRSDDAAPRAATAGTAAQPVEAQASENESAEASAVAAEAAEPDEAEAMEAEAMEAEAPGAEGAQAVEAEEEPVAAEPAAAEPVELEPVEVAAELEPAAEAESAAEPEPPAELVGVMSPAGEPEQPPSGDELLAAAEAAESTEDAARLRSMVLAAARAYAREGRFEAALDAAQRLLRSDPSDVETHLVLVELYMARDWNALAIEKLVLLERLARLSGDDEARQRVCVIASRAYPGDERLGAACA